MDFQADMSLMHGAKPKYLDFLGSSSIHFPWPNLKSHVSNRTDCRKSPKSMETF